MTYAGSSPRVRGTSSRCKVSYGRHRFIPARAGNTTLKAAHRRSKLRFIPARAGNTAIAASDVSSSTVHPRACGERSSCKRLCQIRIYDVKQRTNVLV